jgi:hypothetical protein
MERKAAEFLVKKLCFEWTVMILVKFASLSTGIQDIEKKYFPALIMYGYSCRYPLHLLLVTFASPCIIIQFKKFKQKDATVSQVDYLAFMCESTCFGRLSAHHKERTTALGASGFTVGAWL